MAPVSEKIDERILRLLGLEDVFDIDYDTYLTLLKEAIVAGSKKLPQEELALLANERKRIRGKKGRFSPKKDKINASKVATTKLLRPAKKTLALAPSPTTSVEGEGGSFIGIKKTLDSILKTLGSKFKFDQKQADQDRKEKETEKRGKRESTLEGFKKGVAGIVSTTKKMLSPFQAIIDRIWRFVFFTLLGRAFTKFMDWMSDKENQNKFNSFIEFLSDHWPALAGLYILFGTGFGKLVRGLLKGVTRMIVALAMSIPKIFGFIRKNKKLAFLALAAAPLVSREIGNLFTDKPSPETGLIPTTNPDLDQVKQSTDQAANTQVPKLNLGGMIPSFKMGGMSPFGGMGGMDFYGGVPISGAGQDDTLIAAKTGEAILTERDQQDIGQRYIDRTTGQPLNIPQYLAGRKPGSVSMGNLSFPGFGGGFFGGGMISKFNTGGMVGRNPKMEDIKSQAHNSTVRIERGEGYGLSGSGVLVRNDNGTHSVLTAGHVLDGYVPGEEGNTIKIVTPDGKKHDIDPNSLVRQPGVDMATIKFKSKENYILARPGDPTKLKPGDTTYVSGYPINSKTGMQESALRFTTGKSIIPKYSYEGDSENLGDVKSGYTMSYDNPTQVGMSGGIVFNSKGELIGIHGRGSGEGVRQGSRAIPISHYPQGFVRGGLIKENTGMNIRGATADRQMVAAQPGEYMIPKDTVDRLRPSFFEKLVAMTDSNSNAYLQKGKVNRPQITPYKTFGSSGMDGMITLPPITQSAGGGRVRSAGLGGGSEVPEFSAIAPNNERAMNASIYGLVG